MEKGPLLIQDNVPGLFAKHNNETLLIQRDPAPASLLKLIKCNCSGKFDKNTFPCRMHDLSCSLDFSQCNSVHQRCRKL